LEERRAGQTDLVLRGFAVLLTFAVGFGLTGCAFGSAVDRTEYVNENKSVFRELPRFPGSRLESESSSESRDEEDGPVVGYVTLFDFALPVDSTPDQVAAFFEARLRPDWRLVEELDGPVLNFRRGQAAVSINLESWRGHELEIAVDHAFYPRPGH
jgi:hypothetical protein